MKPTACLSDKPVTNEQLAALLLVAERHRLDPFTKELYAYPDKAGGIVPVVGIDGWLRIINEHPMFDGMETHWDNAEGSMTCTIWRKDRRHPIVVTEYLSECRRNTEPWKMVHRMMRHKATMQCGRYAFGFAGIHDDDEAQDILGRGEVRRSVNVSQPVSSVERWRSMQGDVTDVVPTPVPEVTPAPTPDTDPDMSHRLADYLDALSGMPAVDRQPLLEAAQEDLSEEDYQTL